MANIGIKQFAISSGGLNKIGQIVINKAPLTVISQDPPPGTPLIAGMTVTVHAVSLSDVPFSVLDNKVNAAVLNIPVADVQAVVDGDPILLGFVQNGITNATDRAAAAQKLNADFAAKGYQVNLSATDAGTLVKSISTNLYQ